MMSEKEIRKNYEKEVKEEMSDTEVRLSYFKDPYGSHIDLYGSYVDPCRFEAEDFCCCFYDCR